MTRILLKHRERLAAKHQSALDRWPARSGKEFVDGMQAVVRDFEALAREADAAGGNRIERSRTWRFAGLACFDLANTGDSELLMRAADAFEKAEALLEGSDQPIEQMKVNYCHGQTLVQLSDGKDLARLREARHRFAVAVEIARAHMPDGVEEGENALANTDRMLSLLQQAEDLSIHKAKLEKEIKARDNRDTDYASIHDLYGVLEEEFVKEKSKGQMDPARQSGLGDVMTSLKELLEKANPQRNRTLEDMSGDRGTLEELMVQMGARLGKPSFAGPPLDEGSRAAKVLLHLQDLKKFVTAESMRRRKSDGETDKAMDLFIRMARLTTRVHETQGDGNRLLSLETEQARSLVNEVRAYARRHYVTLARPVWSHGIIPPDPNLVFFSGPEHAYQSVARIAEAIGLKVTPAIRLGADIAESRWQDLRASSLGVFDVSSPSPQVFYELGMALALGTELLLVAASGSELPFDISQQVYYYDSPQDFEGSLATHMDDALYGLQCRGSDGSSLETSVDYASGLAQAAGNDGLLRVAADSLEKVRFDPVVMPSAFKLLNSYLGERAQMLLHPRWPGSYPDLLQPRCFVIMPFREKLNRIYKTIQQACEEAGIESVRGDVAQGQDIIRSIWDEIGRAAKIVVDLTDFNPNVCLELGMAHTLGRRTLLIAEEGTDKLLEASFPSISKRRCHTYPADLSGKPMIGQVLARFFMEPLS